MSFFKYGMVVDGDSPRHGRWPHVTGVTPEYFVTDRLQWGYERRGNYAILMAWTSLAQSRMAER